MKAEGWERHAGSLSTENPDGKTGYLNPLHINKVIYSAGDILSLLALHFFFSNIVLFKYRVGAGATCSPCKHEDVRSILVPT